MVAFDWKKEWFPPLTCLLEKAIGQEGDLLILQCEVSAPWNCSSLDSAEEIITGCLWPLGSGHGFPWNSCLYWLTWQGHLQLEWQLPHIFQILFPKPLPHIAQIWSPKPPVDHHVHYCTISKVALMSCAIYDIYGNKPVSISTPKSLTDMSLPWKKDAFS